MAKSETPKTEDDSGHKKKRRNLGSFPCSQCPKVFTRSDHLARHYLNHQPKEVYVCEKIIKVNNGEPRVCGKTFVRKDLKERHLKRHKLLEESGGGWEDESPEGDGKSLQKSPSRVDSENSDELRSVKPPSPDVETQKPRHSHSGQVKQEMAHPELQPPRPSEFMGQGQESVQGFQQGQHPEHIKNQGQMQPQGLMPNQGQVSHEHIQQGHIQSHGQQQNHGHIQSQGQIQNHGQVPNHIQNQLQSQNQLQHQHQNQLQIQNQGAIGGRVQGHQAHQGMLPNQHQQVAQAPQVQPLQPMPPQAPLQQPFRQLQQLPQAPLGPPVPQMSNPTPEMYRFNPHVPQSQNDILSWLLTDQDPYTAMPREFVQPYPSSNVSGSPELSLNGLPSADFRPQLSPRQNSDVSPFYYNPVPESMINMNLQDLNFFSNNDNPLDEVFLRSSNDPAILGSQTSSKSVWNISSTNSSSPNTDPLTPRSVGEHSPEVLHLESIESRVGHHSARNTAKHSEFFVDACLIDQLVIALPGVSLEAIEKILKKNSSSPSIHDRFSFYLYGYWEVFHQKFPILHKPSFDTKTAEPLLLLAMIMVGCSYCATTDDYSTKRKHCPEYQLAMLIASPLRFTLFQHEDFRSPVRVWILQTLNLLEWCEKNCLQRPMHERAHIHHGTTVQLLRRSPFLGGNPTVANKMLTSASENNSSAGEEDGHLDDLDEAARSDQALFNKWVESESMKRVTFMTFYLDVIDYLKFRHNPQIPFFQLQLLNLPCEEDSLWASYEINGSFKKTIKRQRKLQKSNTQNSRVSHLKNQNQIRPGMNFLSALKKVMRQSKKDPHRTKVSFFTRSILFGGIVSIMHQMQQTELQSNFSQIMSSERVAKTKNQKWKEVITAVIDNYDHEIYAAQSGLTKDSFLNLNRWQCRYPMYHLAQIIGMSDINHYDIAIFGGSPANMSVDATTKDYNIVQKKLNSMWVKSPATIKKSVGDLVNYKCVVHCYWLLWGLMLAPLGKDGLPASHPYTYDWRVDHDIHDSLYAVSIATMVLWCYCYSVYGPESSRYAKHGESLTLDDTRNYDKISEFAAEDAYQYLFRVRQEFTDKIKAQDPSGESLLHSTCASEDQVAVSQIVEKYSELLPTITNKQNISGLCFLVGTKLLRSQWSIIRENAKLIINAGLRSAGKTEIHCPDLFTDDFTD